VKHSPKLAHIPVVLLTGAFEPVDQARASAAGCDGVLAKPFEPQLVIGRVKELLSTPAAHASTTAQAAAPAASVPAPPSAAAPAGAPSVSRGAETATAGAPIAAGAAPASAPPLNDYFDRLDQAFATMASQPAPPAKPTQRPAPATIAEQLDWYAATPADATPD